LKVLIFFIILVFLTFCGNNSPPSVFKKEVAAQIKPPEELAKLESVLYEFLLAADQEGFARTHHIFFREGRLRVHIVMDPLISANEKEGLIKTYGIGIEKGSGNLLRATVPVEALTSLAGEKLILSIRLPDRPMVQ
jgi:hypothetical protein